MASGQPENELTVIVRYPDGKMRVHTHEVLARTGEMIRIDRPEDHNPYEGGVKPKYIVDYSIKDCRKLFRLMAQWLEWDDLDRIDRFIEQNDKWLYKEWTTQRILIGR